jgi:hypothetical protein
VYIECALTDLANNVGSNIVLRWLFYFGLLVRQGLWPEKGGAFALVELASVIATFRFENVHQLVNLLCQLLLIFSSQIALA